MRRFVHASFVVVGLTVIASLAGCSGATSDIDQKPCALPEGCPNGSGGGSSSSSGAVGGDGGSELPSGPRVTIAVRGTTTPVAHPDPWSGETPKKQIVAIRSLYLLRSPTDPKPVQVFDLGANSVEAELVGGKKVTIANVGAKSLPAGVFTIAKAGVSYVRYSVDARLHSVVAVDGQYENVQALSDGAVIDGVTHAKGHFRYSFVANGTTYGTLEGEDAPVPALTATGGLTLDGSGPQAFYVFPAQVAIDPNITVDHEALLELNVHESFRWQDQEGAGYTSKVFDTTASTFEPVMSFGASASTLTITPAAQ